MKNKFNKQLVWLLILSLLLCLVPTTDVVAKTVEAQSAKRVFFYVTNADGKDVLVKDASIEEVKGWSHQLSAGLNYGFSYTDNFPTTGYAEAQGFTTAELIQKLNAYLGKKWPEMAVLTYEGKDRMSFMADDSFGMWTRTHIAKNLNVERRYVDGLYEGWQIFHEDPIQVGEDQTWEVDDIDELDEETREYKEAAWAAGESMPVILSPYSNSGRTLFYHDETSAGIGKYVDENGDPGHPKPSTTNYKENAGYENKALENGDALVFVSKEYGSDQKIEIFCDNPNLCEILGLTKESAKAVGVDAKAALIPKDATNSSQFENTATLSAKGNKITISDRNDFKMVFEVEPGIVQTTFEDVKITAYDGAPTSPSVGAVNPNDYVEVAVSVLDAGPMDLQIGANEGQVMSIRIPKVNPATLGIDKINLSTPEGAQEAIQLLDIAINEVSAIRSKLGAYQNRLEHSISNLNVTAENMTESLSRIADVDMALEMANYTQQNVLSQTGTAMLAQANQRPQSILTLLQQ